MAKRLTDTEKWDKEWFRKLPAKMKVAWEYLRDRCDFAGIWNVDLGLMEFQTGCKLTLEEILAAFPGKVVAFDSGHKLWLTTFCAFQYGTEYHFSKVSKSARNRLVKHGLIDEEGLPLVEAANPNLTVAEGLPNPPGIGKGIGIGKKRGSGGKTNHTPSVPPELDFEPLWERYPRKIEKQDALKRFQQVIHTEADYNDLAKAVATYAAYVAEHNTEERHVKHFSTFLEKRDSKPYTQPWRDWIKKQSFTPLARQQDPEIEAFDRQVREQEEERKKQRLAGL